MARPVAGMRCVRRRSLAAAGGAVALLLSAGASAVAAEGMVCPAPQQPMMQAELIFSRNIGKRLGVNEPAWSKFLAREVTPRFPEGLTVVEAYGQWQDQPHGRVVREPSKMVMVVTADDVASREKISAIVTAYKQQFHQQSVGVITRVVCATF